MAYAWESMAQEDIMDALDWSQKVEPVYAPELVMEYKATARGNIVASFSDWQGTKRYAQIILIAQELTEEEYEAIEWN